MNVENEKGNSRKRKDYHCEYCKTSFATEKQLHQHQGISHGKLVRTAIITISTHRETLEKIDRYLTMFNDSSEDKVSRSKFIMDCVKEKMRESVTREGLKAVERSIVT